MLNWARLQDLGAQPLEPADEGQLVELVRAAGGRRVKVVGSAMTNNGLVAASPGGLLISLAGLDRVLAVSPDSVTVGGGMRLGALYNLLADHQRMLPACPGVITRQTIAGAIATGTHGQGLGQSTLADCVIALRVVRADGSVATIGPGDGDLGAWRTSLGALGIVTAVTLRTIPTRTFGCVKEVSNLADLGDSFVSRSRAHQMFKAWWFPQSDEVRTWAVDASAPPAGARLKSARWTAAGELEHAAPDAAPGPAPARLAETIGEVTRRMQSDTGRHARRMTKTVTRFLDGETVHGSLDALLCKEPPPPQLNCELAVPLEETPAALRALRGWFDAAGDELPLHYPVILRATGASSCWLSPAYGREVCYFGFLVYTNTADRVPAHGYAYLDGVHRVLAAFGARPHWGKYWSPRAHDLAALYPRWREFWRLRDAVDPRRVWSNPFLDALAPAPRVRAAG